MKFKKKCQNYQDAIKLKKDVIFMLSFKHITEMISDIQRH